MELKIYYKGQIVLVNISEASTFEDAYKNASEKLNLHFSQELQLLINNVRLRVKRTNQLVKLKDLCRDHIKDKDTIVIEPEEKTVTPSKQNCHAPRRYKDNIANDNQSSFHKPLENINELVLPIKSRSRVPHELPNHKYQKSDQLGNRNSQNFTNYFDRNSNTLRRSLGAAVAPQFDINPGNHIESNGVDYLSDSSISDFNNPSVNYRKPESNQNNSTNHNTYQDVNTNPYKHKKSPSARKRHKDNTSRSNKSTPASNSTMISKSAPASPNHFNNPPNLLQSINASGLLSQKNTVSQLSHLTAHNVRTIGEKVHVRLQKKPQDGLGFTLVTRDNPVFQLSGESQTPVTSAVILVNKILAKGGAAESGGLLLTGDRILEVNGVAVGSMKQTTDLLRGIPEEDWVDLLVSRRVKQDIASNNAATETQATTKDSSAPKSQEDNSSSRTVTVKIELPEPEPHNLPYQLGMKIQDSGSVVVIHTVLPGSLAAQANLQPSDTIVAVNHQSTIQYNAEFVTCLLSQSITKAGNSPSNKDARTIHLTVIKHAITPFSQSGSSSPHKYKQNHNNNNGGGTNMQLLPNKMPASLGASKHRSRRHCYPTNHTDSNSDYSSTNDIAPDPDAFSRDAHGRRSMSEKRKAHVDPSQYRFYQSSRLGNRTSDKQDINTDRLYNTLPTQLKKKKRADQSTGSTNQLDPPPLPSKAASNQQPVRPSHIKQMQQQNVTTRNSTGTSPTDSNPPPFVPPHHPHQQNMDTPPRVVPRAPVRSVSLKNNAGNPRDAEKIKRYSHFAKSPNNITDDTDSQDSPHTNHSLSPVTGANNQSMFNRAMNNSFKRAVHRSIDSSSTNKPGTNTDHDESTSVAPAIPPKSTPKKYGSTTQPRSHSLKYNDNHHNHTPPRPRINNNTPNSTASSTAAANKNTFSYKQLCNFTPSSLQNHATKMSPITPRPHSSQIPNNTKSDTYPTNQCEMLPHSPNYMHSNDPIIETSNKRVVEWQIKNADYMAKPLPDNNQYSQPMPPPPPPQSQHAPRVIYNTPTPGTNTQKSAASSPKIKSNQNKALVVSSYSKFLSNFFACCSVNRFKKRKIYESHKSPVQSPVKSSYPSQYDSTEPPYETLDRYNNNGSAPSKKKTQNDSSNYSNHKRYATSAPYTHNPNSISTNKRSTTPITTRKHTKNPIELYATVSKHTGRNYLSGNPANKHTSPSPGNRNKSRSSNAPITPTGSATTSNKHKQKFTNLSSAKYKF